MQILQRYAPALAVGALISLPVLALAQQTARVVSSTPVVEKIPMTQKVCAAQAPADSSAPNCAVQTTYRNNVVGYNVVYEYAGQEYSVRMPQDPGKTLIVQLVPAEVANQASVTTLTPPPATVLASPTYVYGGPYYDPYYYYPPIGFAVGLGLGWGWGHGWGWGGHGWGHGR